MNESPRRRLAAHCLSALLGLAAVPLMAQEDIRLPDIGSSAGAVLSRQDEQEYAKELMRQLRQYQLVVEDPLLVEYLDTLAYRLVEASDRPSTEFTFVLLNIPVVNAFATPGGVVAVHTGLILEARSESEVAAVIAHEIAHVTQHHIARRVEGATLDQIPILLGMVGAILAGGASGSGDAAQAAVLGGVALMQQRQINFTRSNEYEADRVGITTLARASFDVDAMAVFFGRMARLTRTNSAGIKAPEYLRTHPVTTTRMAEAKARADNLRQSNISEQPSFGYMRERIRVLAAAVPGEVDNYYRDLAQSRPLADHERYGQALAAIRLNDGERALRILASLDGSGVQGLPVALARVSAMVRQRDRDGAVAAMEQIRHSFPAHRVVVASYARMAVELGDRDLAEAAEAELRSLLLRDSDDPALWELHARNAELAGDLVRAAESQAEATYLRGRAFDALSQLEEVEKRPDLDYYQRARIQAQIARMTPLALEQRERFGRERPPEG
ncbi:MAG: M48 family metallopeptidase [Xanthomonadales bacterium]|nr:M48 family metallopeptidase [Xanthomonadales bacterium]